MASEPEYEYVVKGTWSDGKPWEGMKHRLEFGALLQARDWIERDQATNVRIHRRRVNAFKTHLTTKQIKTWIEERKQ